MERSASFSFIAEHMMVRTSFMRELIQAIKKGSLTNGQWVWAVLSAIDESQLSYSAFSEFETYGNYVNSTHGGSMAIREIRSLRTGAGRSARCRTDVTCTGCHENTVTRVSNPYIVSKVMSSESCLKRCFQSLFACSIIGPIMGRPIRRGEGAVIIVAQQERGTRPNRVRTRGKQRG